jgi:hypothetical protein
MTYQIVNNAHRMFEYSPLLVFLVVILMFCSLRFMFNSIYYTSGDTFCSTNEECAAYNSSGEKCYEKTDGSCIWNGENCVLNMDRQK